ncbi:hypothetical protein JCM8547_004306 [Rhodosporidiobolus lusitaniae]
MLQQLPRQFNPSRAAHTLISSSTMSSTSFPPATPSIALPNTAQASAVPGVVARAATSPYPAWSTSAALLASVPFCVRNPFGYPHLLQLPAAAGIFGFSGYMVDAGDALNGAGTTTAWSLTYLFFNARKAFQSRRPGPIGLAGVAAAQAGVYGWWYFSQ